MDALGVLALVVQTDFETDDYDAFVKQCLTRLRLSSMWRRRTQFQI